MLPFIQKEKRLTPSQVISLNQKEETERKTVYDDFEGLECLKKIREDDTPTQIQFRDCLIDYTFCPNEKCIKKLV